MVPEHEQFAGGRVECVRESKDVRFFGLLNELHDEDGCPIFGDEAITRENFQMEYRVNSLGEPRPTSLDTLITGKHIVAIEC
jgi:hypothetical protein